MSSQNTPKRVAILMNQDNGYCRGVTSGIINFFEAENPNWIIHDAQADARVLPNLIDWEPDGIIAHLFEKSMAEKLLSLNLPIISTTETLTALNVPTIDVDNEAVGRMAAEYFLRKGFKQFGYYGSGTAHFSQKRIKGFKEVLEKEGYEVSSLEVNFLPHPPFEEPWGKLDRTLCQWLDTLEKPVAILASNDLPARIICEACRQTGLRIPQDLALLGVDNDTSECRMASTSISSIDTPAAKIGYRAAEMLHDMLNNDGATIRSESLSPIGVIERDSTNPSSKLSKPVRRGLEYIESNSNREICVDDVSKRSGISRRSLERAFSQELNASILRTIHYYQVEHAKRLLRETDLPINLIADRAGFSTMRKFDRLFSKFEKNSPRTYRSASKAG